MKALILFLVSLWTTALASAEQQPIDFSVTDGSGTIQWDTLEGHTYFLKSSPDLQNWIFLPEVFAGSGEPIARGISARPKQAFFQLESSSLSTGGDPDTADFDRDGLTNLAELTATPQTSPLLFDSDQDGLSDGFEQAHGLNPTRGDSDADGVLDADEDSDGDGTKNRDESASVEANDPSQYNPLFLNSEEYDRYKNYRDSEYFDTSSQGVLVSLRGTLNLAFKHDLNLARKFERGNSPKYFSLRCLKKVQKYVYSNSTDNSIVYETHDFFTDPADAVFTWKTVTNNWNKLRSISRYSIKYYDHFSAAEAREYAKNSISRKIDFFDLRTTKTLWFGNWMYNAIVADSDFRYNRNNYSEAMYKWVLPDDVQLPVTKTWLEIFRKDITDDSAPSSKKREYEYEIETKSLTLDTRESLDYFLKPEEDGEYYLLPVEFKVYRPQEVQNAVSWKLSRDERVIPRDEIDQRKVGIRVNGDGIDARGENDLIEVEVNIDLPAGLELVAKKTSPDLKMYSDQAGTRIALNANEAVLSNSRTSYWVEATDDISSADLDFYLRPSSGSDIKIWTIPFRTFKTVVACLSGENNIFFGADPQDQGTYPLSESLYLKGYNIHYYPENKEDECKEELNSQGSSGKVSDAGVIGYSHGGGSTFFISQAFPSSLNLKFTGYIDAINNTSSITPSSEKRRPNGVTYHFNYYQREGGLKGSSSIPHAEKERDVTLWGLGHKSIDDDSRVHSAIISSLESQISP